MIRMISKIIGLTALVAVMFVPVPVAQDMDEFDQSYLDRMKVDRYLDVEIWTNHSDNEFYEGDKVVLNFRVNRDAFVAIYSIDSRGRVNLLFPSRPDEDNFVRGGASYRLPGGNDDYELVVTGPQGVENIQIIASRDRFPIPDWYPTSGLICDWDDRLEYMDYLNSNYFLRYDGQRFAFDRTAIYINEWERHYYRPVYYPYYPSWSVCGNVYIDYPWGATVYINGIYWGVTPLYIPRIYVGWHTFTIYDYYGYCWEYPVHVTRYNTVILDRTIVVTSPTVVSKYKDVRLVGYRDPVKHGYPDFKTKKPVTLDRVSATSKVTADVSGATDALTKKYVRGSSKLVKNEQGFETVSLPTATSVKGKSSSGSASSGDAKTAISQPKSSTGSKSASPSSAGPTSRYKSSTGSSSPSDAGAGSKSGTESSVGKSSDYYQKKSGSSTYKPADAPSKAQPGKVETPKTISPQKSGSDSKAKSPAPSKVSSEGKSSQGSQPSGQQQKPSSDQGKSAPAPKAPKSDAKTKK